MSKNPKNKRAQSEKNLVFPPQGPDLAYVTAGWNRKYVEENPFGSLPARMLLRVSEAVDEDACVPGELGGLGGFGGRMLDATSALMNLPKTSSYALCARQLGVWCGLAAAVAVAEDLAMRRRKPGSPPFAVDYLCRDGAAAIPGEPAAILTGPAEAILLAERSILNMVAFLSGIATLTRRFVDAAAGTPAQIYDTRKTLPGFRPLSKYAVRCGGGHNHRMGLFDAVLIKDNHLADVPLEDLQRKVTAWVAEARQLNPRPAFFEVETDSLAQFDRLAEIEGVDVILLDNFPLADVAEAVRRRNAVRPRLLLEVSGGVTLETVRPIAETGVERISIGALTHSAPALDVGLDAEL